ncbi:MAG: alkaline phosphatase PhoX, partial [Nocardioides sp.]
MPVDGEECDGRIGNHVPGGIAMTLEYPVPTVETSTGNELGRRAFLRGTAAAAGLAGASIPFEALAARHRASRPARLDTAPGYGPLRPVRDEATGLELLALPKGFEYVSYGWANDVMSDGVSTPNAHDGMAAFRADDLVSIVRNHERNPGPAFTAPAYNPGGGGGTTTMIFDPGAGRFLESYGSLGGTVRNCAGGPTPWGTWLTCEETFSETAGLRHGYVFEVPSQGKGNPVPYTAMGRFNHEAAAVDPATGYVYETEDRGDASLYRFRPTVPGDLSQGGALEAMKIGAASLDTRQDGPRVYGAISWVP